MLCVYLYPALFLIYLAPETASLACPDATHWDRLSELVPPNSKCGLQFKNLQSTRSKDNPQLHYANLEEFPSMVSVHADLTLLNSKNKSSRVYQMCNGVLITTQHVLTAASCLQEPPVPWYNLTDRIIRVIVGDYNTDITEKDCVSNDFNTTCAPSATGVLVTRVMPHEHFNRFSFHHDIAVLELSESVQLTDYIQPICLSYGCYMDEHFGHSEGQPLTYVGWRIYWPQRNTTSPPSVLQKIQRVVKESPDDFQGRLYGCEESYLWNDPLTQLCTHLYPEDPSQLFNCDAVNGGSFILESSSLPTQTRQVVFGIASYGESCKLGRALDSGDPLVVTWVPPYVRWILKTLYFLKNDRPYPYHFSDIRWSTGVEGD